MSAASDPGWAGLLAEGFLLGWSVAWPPGPINAEMIRRGIAGGFWSASAVGLGASSGDFLWAVGVAAGVGALANIAPVRIVLAGVSLALLLLLAFVFLRGAWRSAMLLRAGRHHAPAAALRAVGAGYGLGFTLALTSPWNVAFWMGVMGQRATGGLGWAASLALAAAVCAGALTWVVVLCSAVRLGARFATPAWEITTRALTGLLMLYFAGRLAYRLAVA